MADGVSGCGPVAGARYRRLLTTAMPLAVPLGMRWVFRTTVCRMGSRRGYRAGFAVYWASCWVLALALAGPRRLAAVWRRPSGAVAGSDPLALAAVLAAPVGGVVTQWLPQVRRSGPAAVAAAIVIGVTNASAEEALWRALPVAMFPGDRVRGWLWPAAGFVV